MNETVIMKGQCWRLQADALRML